MRIVISIFIILFASCKAKYPAERYTIPAKYRELVASFKPGDTLRFRDNKNNHCLYLITAIDSSFVNEGIGLISAKGRKDMAISCKELTNPRQGYETYYMFILNRYPDEDTATFDVRLKDFYGNEPKDPGILHTDTITANGLSFTDYYAFVPYNQATQTDPDAVCRIYMTSKDGIIAYRNLNGVWWTKVK